MLRFINFKGTISKTAVQVITERLYPAVTQDLVCVFALVVKRC